MSLCTQKMWVWILSSVFTENRYCSDVELLGIVLKPPTHRLLLTGCPHAMNWCAGPHAHTIPVLAVALRSSLEIFPGME